MSRTFAIIKPDAWAMRNVGSILKHAEDAGLHPDQLWIGMVEEKDWADFYAEHEGKPFFGSLVHFMASGPCVLAVLEGPGVYEDAIKTWRTLMGATDPSKAAEGTLRALYGTHGALNAVHGSDSEESYQREVEWARKVSNGAVSGRLWG